MKLKILLIYIYKIFSSINYIVFIKNFSNIVYRSASTFEYFNGSPTATVPTFVTIEATNICNLKCVMCPSPIQTRKRGHLSIENFKRIVDSLDKSVENISLSFMGETILNKDLSKIIKYAKSKKLGVSLSTNVSFLTREKSEELASSGLDIIILSIDSEKPEVYEDLRRGSTFNEVTEKVKDFLKINNKRIYTIIQKIHLKENIQSTWSYIHEMNQFGAHLVRLKPYRDLDRSKKHHRVATLDEQKLQKIKCPYLWKISVYTWEGELVPCGVDYDASVKIGSAFASTQKELWNSKALQDMRLQHVNGNRSQLNLCNGCSAIEFNGLSMALSSLIDATNQVKLLSVIQTLKILIQNFKNKNIA